MAEEKKLVAISTPGYRGIETDFVYMEPGNYVVGEHDLVKNSVGVALAETLIAMGNASPTYEDPPKAKTTARKAASKE